MASKFCGCACTQDQSNAFHNIANSNLLYTHQVRYWTNGSFPPKWFQWQLNVYMQDLKNLPGDYVEQIVQAKLKSLPIKLIRHTKPFVLLCTTYISRLVLFWLLPGSNSDRIYRTTILTFSKVVTGHKRVSNSMAQQRSPLMIAHWRFPPGLPSKPCHITVLPLSKVWLYLILIGTARSALRFALLQRHHLEDPSEYASYGKVNQLFWSFDPSC
jgi:hypothetical protein